jgi:hypothetical protein
MYSPVIMKRRAIGFLVLTVVATVMIVFVLSNPPFLAPGHVHAQHKIAQNERGKEGGWSLS